LSTSSFFQKNNAQFLSGTISASNHNVKAQSVNQQQLQQQQESRKIVLVQNDFGWNGTSGGPTIRVSKGDVVQITITNAGQMAHNFGIGKPSPQTMKIMNSIMQLPLSERVQKIP
jgi:FtsP/CotA-like multicopper oxidase with cupredoxin domain